MRVSNEQTSGSATEHGVPASRERALPAVSPPDAARRTLRVANSGTSFRSGLRAPRLPLPPDVEFLERRGIPRGILETATRLAFYRGTAAREELFACGFGPQHYWRMLAEDLGLPFAAHLDDAKLQVHPDTLTTDVVCSASSVPAIRGGSTFLFLSPDGEAIPDLRRRLRRNPDLSGRLIVAAPETIRAFILVRRGAALGHYAVNRLSRVIPSLSARGLSAASRLTGPIYLLAALLGLFILAPLTVLTAIGWLATAFFANCSFWKLRAAFRPLRSRRFPPVPSERLPTYTVLVPLYREAEVLPDLVKHLSAIDYPASKLEILILLEADDLASRQAAARFATAPLFQVLVAPPGGPRTKPKALTWALPFARGDLVVVYDAEDRPEPDQLRKAAAAFARGKRLGCVQARLAPDNRESWLARMFALEYAANFEVLLPSLAAWGVPLPLGGTSNHFPREVLEKVGAWDPFNVTEDADLGIRLARFGYRSVTIASHTWEEAPVEWRQWLPQRRRWIKGWIQTSLLSLRTGIPGCLKLPLRERLALHGIMTAGVLGLLLYPLSLLLVLCFAASFARGEAPTTLLGGLLLVVYAANGLAILLAAVASTLRGLRATKALKLAWELPLLPVYWLLMSYAAWQAVWQFLHDPSAWEKTRHGVARDRRTPPTAALPASMK